MHTIFIPTISKDRFSNTLNHKKICCEFINRVIKNQEWLQKTFDPIV